MEGISETLTFTAIVKNDEIELLRRFQSFIKLQRVVAYCYRYRTKHKGPLSVEELNIAQTRILIWTQTEPFPEEISKLRTGKTLATNSFLLRLNPFVDQEGLIRVGGRLRNATIPEEQKHQIILPAKHHITHIIMREEHEKLMHCGPQQLLFHIRQKYWPISGGREARRVTTKCVACYRYKPKVPEIRMGDLPKSRVTVSAQPFETTGVDYAGPLQVRESKRRGRIHISKSYIAIFTCFATKAVHLELVTDLLIEAFLAALRRFVNRRGVCNTICSDNATNFVGASRELKQMYEFLGSHEDDIQTGLSLKSISWKVIPPRSPHFGGLWESAVKSVKRHLYTVTNGLIYTYEEYYSFLTEIEAILNSRPLMPISSNPNDLTVLTPAHFLIAKPSMLEPDSGCFTGVADTKLTRWQQIHKLKQHFWKRWESEYLHHQQTRTKWKSGEGGFEPGTMVLLIDDNRPTLRWNMGHQSDHWYGWDCQSS